MLRALGFGFIVGLGFALVGQVTPARAGEYPLGVIVITDGGSVNNSNNFAGHATSYANPYQGKPFAIGPQPGAGKTPRQPITVICTAACVVGVDIANCGPWDAGFPCLPLAADEKLTTDCNTNGSTLWDGGSGCLVTVQPTGGGAVNATVWRRNGVE